jgi:hypothetical protein
VASDVPDSTSLRAHGLAALVQDGALRRISFAGTEVVRLIDAPIRDADWGTKAVRTLSVTQSDDRFARDFVTIDGALDGRLQAGISRQGAETVLTVTLQLNVRHDTIVNRAGFVVLHPLEGVTGATLHVRAPDGQVTQTHFPMQISAAQPVMNIASLSHQVGPVSVTLDFDGDIFEMEDQRNWTDASFKTYCRPLSLPRPYTLAQGDVVRQTITLTLRADHSRASDDAGARDATGVMPAIHLVQDGALCGPRLPPLDALGVQGVLLRLSGDMELPAPLPALPVTLELVTGDDPGHDLARAAAICAEAGLVPDAVIALPRPYLQSHQPQGPWPDGPAPMDLIAPVRAAFPGVAVGGGMLTNFTEFNRCPPDPSLVDFTTFGTTAIVHAADDMSVLETPEALAQVIASAASLSGGRPMRLGLMSIAMRSNPYGTSVVANPDGARVPMAMDDPRQRTSFGAAFAIGVAAACAAGGVASFAPAMVAGPLGMGTADRPWPIWHAVAALAALAGAQVTITHRADGLVVIRGQGRHGIAGVAVNLGAQPITLESPACAIPERARQDWAQTCQPERGLTLAPCQAALLKEIQP